MDQPSSTTRSEAASSEKCRVALSSLLAALVLTGLKLYVGVSTNSLGILAEAAHSGLDLLAAAVTLWAVRMSARPADRQNTYGYGKVENLSALFETLLLLITCLWILYEAVQRSFFHQQHPVDPSIWAFVVVILSVVVDFSRSRTLGRVAKKYDSQALQADALHFSTDIWTSGVVLLGLICTLVARKFDLPRLAAADTIAAVVVAIIIVGLSVKLGKKSVDDLIDRIPDDLRDRVARAANNVADVQEVTMVRMRRSGSKVFADVTLSVGQAISFEKAHEIADQAAEAVRTVVPDADVVVHAEPQAESTLDLTTKIRILAARRGMGAHAICLYEQDGKHRLELHLEVEESLSLDDAHHQASEFEQDVRKAIPDLSQIVSHLEPAGDTVARIPAEPADPTEVLGALADYFERDRTATNLHQVKVQNAGGKLQVSFHCRLDGSKSITEAHDFTVRLEEFLRRRVSNLGRVVIHVEPEKATAV